MVEKIIEHEKNDELLDCIEKIDNVLDCCPYFEEMYIKRCHVWNKAGFYNKTLDFNSKIRKEVADALIPQLRFLDAEAYLYKCDNVKAKNILQDLIASDLETEISKSMLNNIKVCEKLKIGGNNAFNESNYLKAL